MLIQKAAREKAELERHQSIIEGRLRCVCCCVVVCVNVCRVGLLLLRRSSSWLNAQRDANGDDASKGKQTEEKQQQDAKEAQPQPQVDIKRSLKGAMLASMVGTSKLGLCVSF